MQPNLKNKFGETALDIATSKGHTALAKHLPGGSHNFTKINLKEAACVHCGRVVGKGRAGLWCVACGSCRACAMLQICEKGGGKPKSPKPPKDGAATSPKGFGTSPENKRFSMSFNKGSRKSERRLSASQSDAPPEDPATASPPAAKPSSPGARLRASSGDLRQMLGRRKSADDLASPPLSPTAAAAPPADDAPAPAAAVVAGADESSPTEKEKKPAKKGKKRLSLSRSPSAGA